MSFIRLQLGCFRSRPHLLRCPSPSAIWLPHRCLSSNILRTHHRSLTSNAATTPPPSTLDTHPETHTNHPTPGPVEYEGPLTATFRRLKIFSLASLTLSTTLAPFIFIIESSLPNIARIALVSAALSTSAISTGLVAWCGRPYVTTLRRLRPEENGGVEGLEMTTLTLTLRPHITRVYDTAFLVETERPFAKWELRERIGIAKGYMERVTPGQEETVAETLDQKGAVIGRWIVKWDDEGKSGICRQVGHIDRHFNVHEELLT